MITHLLDRPEDVARAVDAFREDGYVVLDGLFTAQDVAGFRRLRERAVADTRFTDGTDDRPLFVTNLVERYPREIWPAVSRPRLLRFAEAVMGPRVQLDSTVLFGAPAMETELRGLPVHWHRDRFGSFPQGGYAHPLLIICFLYLQPMTDDAGPLRVVPGSHRRAVTIAPDALDRPHPEERLLATRPGHLVVIHHNLLHSGSHSVLAEERQFLGIGFNTSAMRQDDTFTGPNCTALARTARRTGDRRALRLLGRDDTINLRQNAGFTSPEDSVWARWADEDDRALNPAEDKAVRTARAALLPDSSQGPAA
ncbi:phytanoyl-CoA dioxygenase family protein [Streptomyces telluris]|uniref:Phytanoyl-CoA dioxygenase family protein n=1 Tax=Streptomyces telluris TaxID=2720021 RepID=A0A9X2LGK9_9ACTN|nr:phytanoyl-CoA dioxygenase family protein [Streptomyces telluris]MCQ8771021.1 phytanoyl-CoA dioxygenase family protein [Streptomyces telluris]NJP79698.1 phytanoyl-CoA dioxygenase family protein [Streptomyces telluris]